MIKKSKPKGVGRVETEKDRTKTKEARSTGVSSGFSDFVLTQNNMDDPFTVTASNQFPSLHLYCTAAPDSCEPNGTRNSISSHFYFRGHNSMKGIISALLSMYAEFKSAEIFNYIHTETVWNH